jgi:light-regulated signal transduction histidine kinase (bacteriophytochrome)
MITGYTQLLAKRYRGKLDADADEFIGYTVDGAQRMQRLINDLLQYSRVGSRGKPFTPVALDGVLAQALDNLQVVIAETDARITHDPLPVVLGDETQLVQLLQNLIGNAIKFRSNRPIEIHIGASHDGVYSVVSVTDNGIGIESQYADRIFTIFQRLHGRDEYPGTGIGLAICKKIVERHGGRIWFDSEPDVGTTFYATLRSYGEADS